MYYILLNNTAVLHVVVLP